MRWLAPILPVAQKWTPWASCELPSIEEIRPEASSRQTAIRHAQATLRFLPNHVRRLGPRAASVRPSTVGPPTVDISVPPLVGRPPPQDAPPSATGLIVLVLASDYTGPRARQ